MKAHGSQADEQALREQMVMLGRSIFERGLTAGSSGNLSVRLDDGWLITPTNSSLGRLDPTRLSRLDMQGRLVQGDPPSKEAFLHQAVYANRPAAKAIVHLHSTHSAAVSCMKGLDPHDCIPPLTAYFVMKIGRLPLVPYYRPGAPELARAVGDLAARHPALLLANHGPLVSGPSLEAALNATEELEETARIFLLLHAAETRPLNQAQIDELKAVFALDF
ncbi:3-oxo-tetronate 4-phosphate decarboxylase [Castellaniella sp.]|uniref:3-oxo-tetronate 4-phosphate decarboxylase n=1 Tax=Castellaniella sp. TaxID=1955812 RepID=UPI00355F97EE